MCQRTTPYAAELGLCRLTLWPTCPTAVANGLKMQADTLTYQSTNVPVVEVGVRREVFMGPYKDPRFARYDADYNPNSVLKFGNMNAPNLSGNWER